MQTIDVFSQKSLKAALDASLPSDLKPGENVIVAAVDDDGVEVVASYRVNRNDLAVELQAAARQDWRRWLRH